MQEFDIIERYFLPLAKDFPGAASLKDDAAVISVPENHDLVVSSDTLNEGIHFLPDDPPHLVAKKALRVNLSDLAAKGARPYTYQLCISMGERTTQEWLKDFCRGLREDQARYGIHLSGGDTTMSRAQTSISITAFGLIEKGFVTTREGASIGDKIFVSGTIGDAYLGLRMLQGDFSPNKNCIDRYHSPQPRLDLSAFIKEYASAAMDVSDGLIADVQKLCRASDVGASLELKDIPLSKTVKGLVDQNKLSFGDVLSGGDDYEILFTMALAAEKNLKALQVPVSEIGIVKAAKMGVVFMDSKSRSINFKKSGWQHHL